jgi:hypothetical protein
MFDRPARLDDILAQSRRLSPRERIRLIERLAADLEPDLVPSAPAGRSLQGLWSDLRPSPSDASLEEARREAWATFPRDDIVDEAG